MASPMRFPNFSLKRKSNLMFDDPEDLTSMGTIYLPCRIKKSISIVVFLVSGLRSA